MEKRTLTIHGVLLDIFNSGVLLYGESGIGKSELALELISRNHKLIADDAVILEKQDHVLIGSCPQVLQNFISIKELGILDIVSLFGKDAIQSSVSLDLIIHLVSTSRKEKTHATDHQQFLNIQIPKITLTMAQGRNLALLVECAAKNNHLKKSGYDANLALQKRHQQYMANNEQVFMQ